MVQQKTHYEALGVRPDANYQQLRKAYMRLSAEYAADRRNFPAAGWYGERVKEAYRVLSDPDARRRYNAELGLPEPPAPAGRETDQWWENVVPSNWYVYAFALVGVVIAAMWVIPRI
jgi:curved DNA-binding protein CbpA